MKFLLLLLAVVGANAWMSPWSRKKTLRLLEKGKKDANTMVTYSIKVYVTPEVVAAYPNYAESVEYLFKTVNKQYKRSKIALKAKLHCIETTEISEADGMNDIHAFARLKRSMYELRGSADLATLFAMTIVGADGQADWFGEFCVQNFPASLDTGITFGHELGHVFGAMEHDGFKFMAGGKEWGTLMNTSEKQCCYHETGFFSNPNLIIDGVPAGDKEHNSAAIIGERRFLVASFGDESRTCGGDDLKWPWETSRNDFSDSECPNLGFVQNAGSLENCTALCLEKSGCTAFNYERVSTSCVMRRCDLPIVPPAQNGYWFFEGYWQSSCSVSAGPAAGKECVFPFTFAGTTFSGCAEWVYGGEHQGKLWCSTKVDSTGTHVYGEGGFCSKDCLLRTPSNATFKRTFKRMDFKRPF